MSASSPLTGIFLTDTAKQIQKKIGGSVSGGGNTQ
jgi:tryptophanyl-tRNA synthetase